MLYIGTLAVTIVIVITCVVVVMTAPRAPKKIDRDARSAAARSTAAGRS